MKKIFNVLIITFFVSLFFYGDVYSYNRNEGINTKIDVYTQYTQKGKTFANLITYLNANLDKKYDLLFTKEITLLASADVPTNAMRVIFERDGLITGNYTLTYTDQHIVAARKRIYGDGIVIEGGVANPLLIPEHWGCVNDSTSDNSPNLKRVIDFAMNADYGSPAKLDFSQGVYKIYSSVDIHPDLWIDGKGPYRGTSNVSTLPGTCILMDKDMNEPALVGDEFIHGFKLTNLRIQQELGGSSIANAHGLVVSGNVSVISGFGELSFIDKVQFKNLGGDGIRFQSGTESTPLFIGHVSLFENGRSGAGNGINFIGNNYGFVYAQSIKGDGNKDSLIRISDVSGNSNFYFDSVGIETAQAGQGHMDQGILLYDAEGAQVTIGQLDVRVSYDRNAGSAVIKKTSSAPLATNPGADVDVVNFSYLESPGVTQGYDYFLWDEDANEGVASANSLTIEDVEGRSLFSRGITIKARDYGTNEFQGTIKFVHPQTVDKYTTIGVAGSTYLRFNHPDDGATEHGALFYDSNSKRVFGIDTSSQDVDFYTPSENIFFSVEASGEMASGNAYTRYGGTAGPVQMAGDGTPESAVTANTSSLYYREDGSEGGTVYIKETLDGQTTGWESITGTSHYLKIGSGTPESNVSGVIGAIYLRTDGGAGTTLYVKESGAGTDTGWIGK